MNRPSSALGCFHDVKVGDVIGGFYSLLDFLGHGAFGDVYIAVDIRSNGSPWVAIKVDRSSRDHYTVYREAKVLQRMQGTVGFPRVHFLGTHAGRSIMAMDLLGPSLAKLRNVCQGALPPKTILLIAQQLLHRIEALHSSGFLHRDIKSENVLIGRGDEFNVIHLIDLGLAKRFLNSWNQQHIPFTKNAHRVGTMDYASCNALLGWEQSRRDDLESLGYLLVQCARGSLPWQDFEGGTEAYTLEHYIESRRSTPVETLCQGSPAPLVPYLKYVRSLGFAQTPNYSYLRRLCWLHSMQEGFVNDGIFDWRSHGSGTIRSPG